MTTIIENEGRTLQNLMQQVLDQEARQADFIAPTNQAQFRTIGENEGRKSEIVLEGYKGEPTKHLAVNGVAFDQIASHANIDVRTARRLRDNYTENWDQLVNAIWQKEPANRMIRSHMFSDTHGSARAWLSDKFKTYDNSDLLQSVLPELMESDANWKIVNADITDRRMYARFKSETITGEGANVGDIMALGLGISNSETGHGSVQVFQINWTLACLNGMQTENRHRKSHITTARGDSETWGLLSDEAKDLDNRALSAKMRDITRAYASRESFDEVLEKMKQAASDVIEGTYTQGAVDQLGQVLRIPKKQTSNILEGLINTIGQSGYENDKPISRATLLNAVTAAAHNAPADQVDDWQKLGGDVLNMTRANWQAVSKASLQAA